MSRGETLDLPLVCLCFCPGFDILNCLCDFEERHKNVNPRPGKGGGGGKGEGVSKEICGTVRQPV